MSSLPPRKEEVIELFEAVTELAAAQAELLSMGKAVKTIKADLIQGDVQYDLSTIDAADAAERYARAFSQVAQLTASF